MTDEPRPLPSDTLRTTRLEAFSDGVFAIAITLLVLEISVPEGATDDLLGAVLDQWPSYLAYVISFASVGAIWLAHSVITHHLHHADSWLMRLNLLLLLVVAFLPFPTGLLAEAIGDADASKVATTVYGLTLLAAVTLTSTTWKYAVHAGLLSSDADAADVRLIARRLDPGLAGYVVMIATGIMLPLVAVLGYLAIAVYYLVPVRSLRRRT